MTNDAKSIRSNVVVQKRALFFTQVIAILAVILACVINLSIGADKTELWASLLSVSLGYLLPAPKIRKKYDSLSPDTPEQQLDEVLPGQQDNSLRDSTSDSDFTDGRVGSGVDGDQLPPVVVHCLPGRG